MIKRNLNEQFLADRTRSARARQTLGNAGKSPVQTIIGDAVKYTCEVVTLWLFIMVVMMVCLYISGA